MAGRSDSYGHIDIGHSGGGGYGHLGGDGHGLSGGEGYGHVSGGGYGHSSGAYDYIGGGGYDSGPSHLGGVSGGYGGHSGGYEHPISYSHESYGHGASYDSYGKMDCPGIPIALLLTTLRVLSLL